MALRFCDGFDHYAWPGDVLLKWTTVATANIGNTIFSTGRFGSGFFFPDSRWSCSKTIDAQSTWIVGFAFKSDGAGYIGRSILTFRDGGTDHVRVELNNHKLVFKRGDGTLLGTGSISIITSCWTYVEFKVSISDTNGVIVARVAGANDTISFVTGTAITQDTRNGGNATADRIGFNGTDVNFTIDDFYMCDTSGSVNNDFLGDIRVQAIYPSGSGNTTQMTPSAGSNYTCVDETAPNGDTDYVSETTSGEKDTYAFGNLTPTSGTVKGVQVLVNARKDDAGSRSISPVYRPASTDYDGSTVSVGDSYAYYREITEVSPETSAAWTIAEINGAEFGVKLIS